MLGKYYLLLSLATSGFCAVTDFQNSWMKGSGSSRNKNPSENTYKLYIQGRLFMVQANEEGLDYVVTSQTTGEFTDKRAIEPRFDWNFGFKVGLGVQSLPKGCVTEANWLHFNNRASRSTTASEGITLLETWYQPTGSQLSLQRADAHLKLWVNRVDLNVGRVFSLARNSSIKALVGLETAWIRQRYKITYLENLSEGQETVLIHNECNFWGIGPHLGLQTFWGITKYFGLLANLDASFLYGYYTTTYNQSLGSSLQEKILSHFRITRVVLNTLIGPEFRYYFNKQKLDLRIHLAWEHGIYFDQNRFLLPTKQPGPGSFLVGPYDLTTQSWVLGFYFGF
jgi:hypothetical protein